MSVPWKLTNDPMSLRVTERLASTLPQTAQGTLFRVTGRVKVYLILGEVTVVIQNQANNTKVVSNPTVGADVDLCAVLDIANDAVGTMYKVNGDFSDALLSQTSGAFEDAKDYPVIVTDGTIDLSCAASNTGEVKWTLHWIPVDHGSQIDPI